MRMSITTRIEKSAQIFGALEVNFSENPSELQNDVHLC